MRWHYLFDECTICGEDVSIMLDKSGLAPSMTYRADHEQSDLLDL